MASGQNTEDELEAALPGSRLTHVFDVLTEDRLTAAIEVLTAVDEAGGRLESLSVAQRGVGLETRMRLGGLAAGDARRLSDRLAALPRVRHAAVEHRLLSTG